MNITKIGFLINNNLTKERYLQFFSAAKTYCEDNNLVFSFTDYYSPYGTFYSNVENSTEGVLSFMPDRDEGGNVNVIGSVTIKASDPPGSTALKKSLLEDKKNQAHRALTSDWSEFMFWMSNPANFGKSLAAKLEKVKDIIELFKLRI